ncbi:MAG: histidine kinase, partial [Cyanobacteria bacterium J06633_2]
MILATSLVAGLTAIGIQQLNVRVDKSTQISLLLTRMKEQLSRLNSLEWEAIAQTEIDDDLEEELIEYRED